MIKPSLPGHTAHVVDKGFLLSTPWRTWANQLTKAVIELQASSSGPIIPTDQATFTITGSDWIKVTGSVESGNFTVIQRADLTTDNLAEGSANLYYTDDRADARITAWAAAPILDPLPPDAVNDAAAATAGVPVNGIYRNGSILMVRVA